MTAHPLFPAIVALWFAALFGLGSLAIRPALIESAVLATGLHALVPAAAPPLGLTARLLIAIAMAALGAVIGVVLARRLAAPVAAAPRRAVRSAPAAAEAEEDAAPRRSFLGRAAPDDADAVDGPPVAPVFPGRRRALAIQDEGQPDIHDFVPLPGGGAPQILDISAFALDDDAVQAAPVMRNAAERPFARPEFVDAAPQSAFPEPVAPELGPELGFVDDVVFSPAEDDAEAPLIRARAAPLPAAETANDSGTASLAADLLPPRRGGVFALAEAAPPLFADNAPVQAQAPEPAPVEKPRFALPTGTAAERIAGADLDSLSHVELIERLALSLQRRRNAEASRAASVSSPSVAPMPAVSAPVEEPVVMPRIGRLPVGAPLVEAAAEPAVLAAMPAAFRPIGFDVAGEEDEDALDHVPLRSIPLPPRSARADQGDEDDEAPAPSAEAVDADDEDDGYASLVEMTVANTPPRQPLIRIEEPEEPVGEIEPVVIFPGQHAARATQPASSPFGEAPVLRQFDPPGTAGLPRAAPAPAAALNDPGEAERALRSALATLQRMNGAA